MVTSQTRGHPKGNMEGRPGGGTLGVQVLFFLLGASHTDFFCLFMKLH